MPASYSVAAALAIAVQPAGQDLHLSRPSARMSHAFSSIRGVRELPDGRVLVSDGIDRVVVRADLARQRLDTIGRAGRGPGEYQAPDLLLPLPDGATLLVDLGNARLTVFDGAGRYRESMAVVQGGPSPGGGRLELLLPRATDGSGRVYYQPAAADPRADSAAVVRWDRSAGRFDTVAQVKLPALVTKESGPRSNRRVTRRPQPYPLQEGWIVAEDGAIALTRVDPYRVDWVLPNGARVPGRPIPVTAVPVGNEEKREYLTEQAANGLAVTVEDVNGQVSVRMSRGRPGREQPQVDQDLIWPRTKPPVTGGGFAGPDGTVWIERSVPARSPRRYDIVGRQGELRRRVTLPKGRQLVGLGARAVYARFVDQDGLAFLERYDVNVLGQPAGR